MVPYHASCHGCDLAFKAAMQLDHMFLDLLADTMQPAASFWNNAPSGLRGGGAKKQRRRRKEGGREKKRGGSCSAWDKSTTRHRRGRQQVANGLRTFKLAQFLSQFDTWSASDICKLLHCLYSIYRAHGNTVSAAPSLFHFLQRKRKNCGGLFTR